MLTPPVCQSCECAIGDRARLFRHLRKKRAEAQLGSETRPAAAAISYALSMDVTDLFEKLGIKHDCCRTRLSMAIDFREVY